MEDVTVMINGKPFVSIESSVYDNLSKFVNAAEPLFKAKQKHINELGGFISKIIKRDVACFSGVCAIRFIAMIPFEKAVEYQH